MRTFLATTLFVAMLGATDAMAEDSGRKSLPPYCPSPAFPYGPALADRPEFPERPAFPLRPDRAAIWLERAFAADLAGDRGTLSAFRFGFDGVASVRLSERLRLRAALAIEASDYHLSDPGALVPGSGELVGKAVKVRIAPVLELRSRNGWGGAIGPIVQSFGAPDADFGRTLTWGGEALLRVPVGRGKSLWIGARFETRLEDSPQVLPLVRLEGGVEGTWSLESRGAGLRLGYAPSTSISLGVALRRERRDVRLAEDDRAPGGVFRDHEWAVGTDFEWKPSCRTGLSLAVWRTIDHQISILDRGGGIVTDVNASDSWQVGLTFHLEF